VCAQGRKVSLDQGLSESFVAMQDTDVAMVKRKGWRQRQNEEAQIDRIGAISKANKKMREKSDGQTMTW
jgi:hypothetical protein